MKQSPPIFAFAAWGLWASLAWAQPPEGVQPLAPAAATPDALVAKAVEALDAHRSILARMRIKFDLLERQALGTGRYLQGPSDTNLVRFELKLQMGEATTSLQQACDGTSLWTLRDVFGKTTLTRVDVKQVLAAKKPKNPTSLSALGLGGLPQLLRGLDKAFRFTAQTPAHLGEVAVIAVRGEWEPAYLAHLAPDQKAVMEAGRPIDVKKLPPHLPDQVILYLGQDDLFPYRVEYRRTISSTTSKTMLDIVMYEVRFNPPLERQEFAFQPGATPAVDETAKYLKQ